MELTKRGAANARTRIFVAAVSGGVGGGVAGGVGAALGLEPLGYIGLAVLTSVLTAIVLSRVLGRR